jgi:hypothetical protein
MLNLQMPESLLRNKSWHMIKNNASFVGSYNGTYGLYHRHYTQLLQITELGQILMVTDNTNNADFSIAQFQEVDVNITVSPKS